MISRTEWSRGEDIQAEGPTEVGYKYQQSWVGPNVHEWCPYEQKLQYLSIHTFRTSLPPYNMSIVRYLPKSGIREGEEEVKHDGRQTNRLVRRIRLKRR